MGWVFDDRGTRVLDDVIQNKVVSKLEMSVLDVVTNQNETISQNCL